MEELLTLNLMALSIGPGTLPLIEQVIVIADLSYSFGGLISFIVVKPVFRSTKVL